MNSFKSNAEIFTNPWGLPVIIGLNTYSKVLIDYGLGVNFLNSILLSTFTLLASVIISILASYAISRMKWKLNKLVLGFFLLGIMIPVHSTLIPLYINLHNLIGVLGAKGTILIPYIAFTLPTSIFILSGFMQSLPSELEEAAVLDGGTIVTCLFRIILPLSKPAIVTITIFNFLGVWNELLFGLVFLSKRTDQTFQVGLLQFMNTIMASWGEVFAGVTIAMIPSILFFAILQDKIVNAVTEGAVKS